jgi:mRNA interferase MazF
MTKYKIVLVPFPFDDLSNSKVRPAVCLTNPIGPHHHIVLAFITSRISDDPLPTDVVIHSNESDFITTGLRTSSTLCLHRMMTATTKIIQRDLGQIPPRLQKQICTRLQVLFELK